MNKIVRDNYPASKLPEDLRPTADPDARVRVIVEDELESVLKRPEHVMTFEEIFALRGFRRRTKEEIDEGIRRTR